MGGASDGNETAPTRRLPGARGENKNDLMTNKPKAKLTDKDKKARASRRAFERICDRIEAGEGVKQITRDKKVGLSNSGFYKMMRAGDDELVDRYARSRAHTRAVASPSPSFCGRAVPSWWSDMRRRARCRPIGSLVRSLRSPTTPATTSW